MAEKHKRIFSTIVGGVLSLFVGAKIVEFFYGMMIPDCPDVFAASGAMMFSVCVAMITFVVATSLMDLCLNIKE